MKKYVLADTHFGDEKVRKLSRDKFKTTDEHDEVIIKNIEKMDMKQEDVLYILGDLGVLKPAFKKRFKAVLAKKILLRGNHDRKDVNYYSEQGIDEVIDFPFYQDAQVIFSHEPQPVNDQYILNVHGDLHGEVIDSPNYINVSVDVNFYKPLDLDVITKRKESLKRIRTKHYDRRWHRGKTKKMYC